MVASVAYVPFAATRDALLSVRYGENRRQKKTHRGAGRLIDQLTDLRVLSILEAASRARWDVDHRQ